MKLLLLCTVALILSAGSCKKNAENRLPPTTQTGANTFGCKINGVVYKCEGLWDPRNFLQSQGIYFQYSEGKMNLSASFNSPKETAVEMNFEYDGRIGIYKNFIPRSFETVSEDSYVKVTRFDKDIFSGEFVFKRIFDDGTIRNVTEGRFDIKKPK